MYKQCRPYVLLFFLMVSVISSLGWQVENASENDKMGLTGVTKKVGAKVESICALAENSCLITSENTTTKEILRVPEENRTKYELQQFQLQEKREKEEREKKEKEEKRREKIRKKKEEAKRRKEAAALVPAVAKTQSSREILLRIVEAEAGDQDIRGRRLVANVILNRVRSKEFPNTVREVVFAGRQFSPVSNGSYYRVKVSEKTRKAVDQALMGVDDSQGALYFMWREGADASNASWFDRELKRLFRYGCHEFYK